MFHVEHSAACSLLARYLLAACSLLALCLLSACSLLARCLLAACVSCRARGARPAARPSRGGEGGTVRALRFSSCLRAFFSLLKSEYYITIVI